METTTVTVVVMFIGLYLFLESFTAINEMEQIRLRDFWREFINVYTMKYIVIGLYGLLLFNLSDHISAWSLILTIPALWCAGRRTKYRLINNIMPAIQRAIARHRFNHAKSHNDSNR